MTNKPNKLDKFMEYYRIFLIILSTICGLGIAALKVMRYIELDEVIDLALILTLFGILDPKVIKYITQLASHLSKFNIKESDGNGEN